MPSVPDFKEDVAEACKDLWKLMLVEFLGTLFLVFVGCGSTVGGKFQEGDNVDPITVPFLDIAICFGLAVGVIVHIIAHVSGGHINPAVTAGMLVARKISVINAIAYVIAQLVGAIAGAALLYATLPVDMRSDAANNLGLTKVASLLNLGQAFEIEFFITFLLVFAVFMVMHPQKPVVRHEPMVIGLVVAVCHIFAIKYTGSSMNPARSFGPALIAMSWTDHWVYWVGPILGGIVAALTFKCFFEVSESPAIKTENRIPQDMNQQTQTEEEAVRVEEEV